MSTTDSLRHLVNDTVYHTQPNAGLQGTNGIQGSTGPQGTTGLPGTNGAQGATGSTGSTGAQGTQGSAARMVTLLADDSIGGSPGTFTTVADALGVGIALAANTKYRIRVNINTTLTSITGVTAYSGALNFPALNATLGGALHVTNMTPAVSFATIAGGATTTAVVPTAISATANNYIYDGWITTGAAGGTLNYVLTLSQTTSAATAAVKAGSYIWVEPVT